MLTYWSSRSEYQAVRGAIEAKSIMEQAGLTVLRLKVEALQNSKGVPNEPITTRTSKYYEYHFKVATEGFDGWNQLAELCSTHGAHLFYNPYSRSSRFMTPVVTLREYGKKEVALERLQDLMTEIKEEGFPPITELHSEYSILDTLPEMDRGWLFGNDIRVPKTDYMDAIPAKIDGAMVN
jgi:hypothetical protein